MRLHGRYHSPLSRALAQFTGALGQVGDDHDGADHGDDGHGADGDYDHGDDDHGDEDDDDDDRARLF